jgi:hypothetical protein
MEKPHSPLTDTALVLAIFIGWAAAENFFPEVGTGTWAFVFFGLAIGYTVITDPPKLELRLGPFSGLTSVVVLALSLAAIAVAWFNLDSIACALRFKGYICT